VRHTDGFNLQTRSPDFLPDPAELDALVERHTAGLALPNRTKPRG
jgi:hypothetical protein